MIRHRLRVVAGRRRDQAALPLVGSQAEELVQSAALLEGTGPLQVLQLEIHGTARQP